MPDWLIILTLLYLIGLVIAFLGPLVSMPSSGGNGYYRHARRRQARIALAAPVWPLWIPIGLTYGIYRLIQTARTGE